ncbi:hypothetical protein [Acidiphilium sp.]|uniref:hypothetical protein n=1 Tax=Acidiphilium sp. TaxID=527 RepID=UPI003D094D32
MSGAESARTIEAEVNEARRMGDIPALIATARRALAQLGAVAEVSADAARVEILKACMRISYNASADIWPGWADGIVRTPAELAAGRDLAVQSASIVARLDQGPVQRGNAVWLIGAFDLAQGNHAAAAAAFSEAAWLFDDEPAMRCLAQGYFGIATGGTAFDAAIAALGTLGGDDADALRDQLLTARRVMPDRG